MCIRDRIRASDGAWLAVSDRRLKRNIEELNDDVIHKVMALKPSSYEYVNSKNRIRNIGLIAQELQKNFPEFVESSEENMAVDYAGLSVVALKAIQEQQVMIEELRKEIRILREQLDTDNKS